MTIHYDNLKKESDTGNRPGSTGASVSCAPGSGFIEANTLNGKPGGYYLWRGNHKGTQPITTIEGLNSILNQISNGIQNSIFDAFNIDGSGTGIYYGKQGHSLYFKRIVSDNDSITIYDDNGVITIGFDASLASKDPSVNELYTIINDLSINVADLSIYVDNKFFEVDASIDAIWNYLNNLNIDVSIGGLNIPPAENGEIFSDVSNNVFRFRTIRGLGDVSISTNGDYVDIFIDASVSGGPIWDDPEPVTASVGGVKPGETFLGDQSIPILEDILYEYFPPMVYDVSLWYQPGGSGVWQPVSTNQILYLEKYVDQPGLFDVSGYFETKTKTTVTATNIYNNATPINLDIFADATSGYFGNGGITISSPTSENIDIWVEISNKHRGSIQPAVDVSLWNISFVNPYYYGVVPNFYDINNFDTSVMFAYAQGKDVIPKKVGK
ncbi:MAG: hypothetical protein HC831_15655 [Chloroflexia bacterium]|nr:hypothetical protein [Chloroflexia bacterium]